MNLRKLFIYITIVLVLLLAVKSIIYNNIYPYKYKEYVDKYSEKYNLDPLFVLSVIKAESNFNDNAKSHKNAYGLMQITDSTAKWAAQEMGIKYNSPSDLKNIEYNIRMGCWYLNNLREEFGDLDLVLASYNGGRGNVNKWLSDERYSKDGKKIDYVPFKETDKYVKKVKVNYNIYRFLYRSKVGQISQKIEWITFQNFFPNARKR